MVVPHLGHLAALDVTIICAYLLATAFLGLRANLAKTRVSRHLTAHHSLPLWMTSASFLAANCGALELLGVSATAAQYGVVTFHFYWIGAVPALICLSLFVLPVYARTNIKSVPEYLCNRFDQRTKLVNVFGLLCITILLSGVALYAVELVLAITFGWPIWLSALIALSTAAIYTTLGGLRATIYNEVLQLAVICCGLLPLLRLLLIQTQGFTGLKASLPTVQRHAWEGIPVASLAAPVDLFGITIGLGFVLGFGYWCTDFVQMQRLLATQSMEAARKVPLIAALGKMILAVMVVVPGLAVLGAGASKNVQYNAILPMLMVERYSEGWLGIGIAGILASLISNLSANASAFSVLFTEEIYRSKIRPSQTIADYIMVERGTTLLALILSALTAVIAQHFQNLMEYIQLIFSVFAAPVFGVVLSGLLFRWVRRRSGFWGLSVGFGAAICHLLLIKVGFVEYGSGLNANFHGAIWSFGAAVVTVCGISVQDILFRNESHMVDAKLSLRPLSVSIWLSSFAMAVAGLCLWFNLFWR